MQATAEGPTSGSASEGSASAAWLAERSASEATAGLLSALFDLLHDIKSRRAQTSGTAQLLVRLASSCPARGSDLAADLHLDQSTVSRHVGALESEGLVRRQANPHDRRSYDLELTEAGRLAADTELRRRITALEAAVVRWSDRDVDEFARLLRQFVAGLRAADPARDGEGAR